MSYIFELLHKRLNVFNILRNVFYLSIFLFACEVSYAQPTMAGFEDEYSLDRLITYDLLNDETSLERKMRSQYLIGEMSLDRNIEANKKAGTTVASFTGSGRDSTATSPTKSNHVYRSSSARASNNVAGSDLLQDVINVVLYGRQSRQLENDSDGNLDTLKMVGAALRMRLRVDDVRPMYDDLSNR